MIKWVKRKWPKKIKWAKIPQVKCNVLFFDRLEGALKLPSFIF